MKKLFLTVSFLLGFSAVAHGQESIGFSDPDRIEPLIDYRLPEWGYHSFSWDFSLTGNFESRDRDELSASDHQFSGRLLPAYIRYRESESRISSLNLRPNLDYSLNNRTFFDDDEDDTSIFRLGLDWNIQKKFYQPGSDLFFSGTFTGDFLQSHRRDEDISDNVRVADEIRLDRDLNSTLSVGIGYGRLRNVNPMIRSLRLNERYSALDTGRAPLGNNDLFSAAEQFTRYRGYEQVYDRPLKSFWGDMDELLATDLASLNPFDLLYLTDTTTETIGQRLEGWEITAEAGLQHLVSYNRDENKLTGQTAKNLTRTTYFTPSLSGAWFKNLSLRHQVGFRAGYIHFTRLDDSEDFFGGRMRYSFSADGNWLYNLTDRILVNTSLSYQFQKRSEFPSFSGVTARSEINYFIENRLAIFSTLFFIYRNNGSVTSSASGPTITTDDQSFIFNAGIRYYMMRGLY